MRFSRLSKLPFMHTSMTESGAGSDHKTVENYFLISDSSGASLKLLAIKNINGFNQIVESLGDDELFNFSSRVPD
jgi:hypothetical protein